MMSVTVKTTSQLSLGLVKGNRRHPLPRESLGYDFVAVSFRGGRSGGMRSTPAFRLLGCTLFRI